MINLVDLWAENLGTLAREFAARIGIQVRCTEETFGLVVADDGPGMPQDVLLKVFDPFITSSQSGVGIGLYLARQIAVALGGRISVTSEVGRGSSFELNIPRIARDLSQECRKRDADPGMASVPIGCAKEV